MKNSVLLICIICGSSVLIASTLLRAQVFPVNEIVINGPDDKRLNIVFLSEGYTLSEMEQFNQDVVSTIDQLFSTSPYQEYQTYFNVYAIEVPSNEFGTDHPGTADDEPP